MLRRALVALALPFALVGVPSPAQAHAGLAVGCPTIVAHKTASHDTPENSVPGIAVAKRLGAPVVELDIRFSKNDFAFAMHNDTVDATTNGTGRIADKYFSELLKLSAADYAPWNTDPAYAGFNADGTPRTAIPYAYSFLAAAKQAGVKLLLDVKVTPTRAQADFFAGYLDRPELRMRDQIIWMANSEAGLRAMRGWYPGLTYWLLERPPAGFMRTGDSLTEMGAVAYSVPIGEVRSAAWASYYHAYELGVATWTTDNAALDTPANWKKARDAGVDTLITDRPDLALAERGPC